jgi:hypothetical protein
MISTAADFSLHFFNSVQRDNFEPVSFARPGIALISLSVMPNIAGR